MDPASLTLQTQLATTPTRAFRALTRAGQLRQWFVDSLDYDRSLLVFGAGRQLTFITGTVLAGQGQVTTYRPPSVLEYSWNNETLRFELDAEGEETCLTFTNTIYGAQAEAIAEASVPDWEDALARLRGMFAGDGPDELHDIEGRE